MKRMITLFGAAIIAVFAFSAISAAIASAELTKILPEPTVAAPLTDVIIVGAGDLLTVSGLEVKCGKGAGKETWTSANNGTAEFGFKECKGALSTTCTGKGESKGEIVEDTEIHFWLALQMETSGSKLIAALVDLDKPGVQFTCENPTKTIKNEEVIQENTCKASKDLNINALITANKEEFAEWTSGETSILSVLPAGATSEIWCLPTIRTNGGATELYAVSDIDETNTYKKAGAALTIELMN